MTDNEPKRELVTHTVPDDVRKQMQRVYSFAATRQLLAAAERVQPGLVGLGANADDVLAYMDGTRQELMLTVSTADGTIYEIVAVTVDLKRLEEDTVAVIADRDRGDRGRAKKP